MTETVYARSPDVVWRLGPDRVLVRRVGGQGERASARPSIQATVELIGPVALVWLALDDPAEEATIALRLGQADAEIADLNEHIGTLVSAGVVVSG